MPFPFRVSGTVSVPDAGIRDLRNRVLFTCIDEFEHAGARVTQRGPADAVFGVPFFRLRMRGWWLTPYLDGASIALDGDDAAIQLIYRLSLWRAVSITTVVVAIMGMVGRAPLAFLVVGWLWLVGVHYAFVAIRARSWFRRRIADAIASAQPRSRHSETVNH